MKYPCLNPWMVMMDPKGLKVIQIVMIEMIFFKKQIIASFTKLKQHA